MGAQEGDRGRLVQVKSLLPECEDEDLYVYFGKFGRVLRASVMREKASDMSRLYGYVCMADANIAQKVLGTDHKIWENSITVSAPDDAAADEYAPLLEEAARAAEAHADSGVSRVEEGWFFVGRLKQEHTGEDVQAYFSEFGEVIEVQLLRDRDGQSRRCGFVRMANSRVVGHILGKEHDMHGEKITVKEYNKPASKGGDKGGGKGRGGEGLPPPPPPGDGKDGKGKGRQPFDPFGGAEGKGGFGKGDFGKGYLEKGMKGDFFKGDYGKGDYGKGDYGPYFGKGFGKGEYDRDFRKGDMGDYDRRDYGKGCFGKGGFDFGKGAYDMPCYGKGEFGPDRGKGDFRRGDFDRGPYGRSHGKGGRHENGRDDFDRRREGSEEHRRDDFRRMDHRRDDMDYGGYMPRPGFEDGRGAGRYDDRGFGRGGFEDDRGRGDFDGRGGHEERRFRDDGKGFGGRDERRYMDERGKGGFGGKGKRGGFDYPDDRGFGRDGYGGRDRGMGRDGDWADWRGPPPHKGRGPGYGFYGDGPGPGNFDEGRYGPASFGMRRSMRDAERYRSPIGGSAGGGRRSSGRREGGKGDDKGDTKGDAKGDAKSDADNAANEGTKPGGDEPAP